MLGIILLASFITSLVSLIGIAFLAYSGDIQSLIDHAVSFSIGALLATVFYGMMAEVGDKAVWVGIFVLVSLVIEKALHWHHCHKYNCDIHPFGWMNLIGDAIHNATDGFAIATGFLVSPGLGWATTFAIIAHEVPQEIGDFFVLLKAGFSIKKALSFNFFVALTALIGAVFGFYLASVKWILPYMISFAAGNLLYIAMVDLMPDIREVKELKKEEVDFTLLIIGFVVVCVAIGFARGLI